MVIEDKADLSKHIKKDGDIICQDTQSVQDYAVNGALFYAKHLANKTSYKKIIAFDISGDIKCHRISPVFVDNTEYYRELPEIESFIGFNDSNINNYYTHEILKEETNTEKENAEILSDAAELHEDLRNYRNLTDTEKPLVVSGILLALDEAEQGNFSISSLTGDLVKTDGKKIYEAIHDNLKRVQVAPDVKEIKFYLNFQLLKVQQN